MSRRRVHRAFALRYDDGFRGLVSLLGSAPPIVTAILFMQFNDQRFFTNAVLIFAALCASFTLFFVIYMIWTHRVFARGDRAELMQIARLQHSQGASGISRAIGMKTAEDWAMSAALTALMVSGAAAILGAREGGFWLPLLVLFTVAMAWATVAYAFALRYFRLHAAGETIDFDIAEEPIFVDFLSMAIMVSAVAATSAGTPRTRPGLTTMRTQTYISFAFNAIVVAMAVSLITSLIVAAGE